MLERLEADRVAHRLAEQGQARMVAALQEHIDRLQQRVDQQDNVLHEVFSSNAYKLAGGVSRLSQLARSALSRPTTK